MRVAGRVEFLPGNRVAFRVEEHRPVARGLWHRLCIWLAGRP